MHELCKYNCKIREQIDIKGGMASLKQIKIAPIDSWTCTQ
jgi:hypothetical protein